MFICADQEVTPGPGVSMAPGRNAAQVILTDLGFDFKKIVAA